MPTRRLVPHVLVTAAVALSAASNASASELPQPVWQEPQAVAPVGEASSGQGMFVMAAPGGGVLVAWATASGTAGRYTVRPAAGDWTAAQDILPDGVSWNGVDLVARANGDFVIAWSESSGNVKLRIIDGKTGQASAPQPVVSSGSCPHLRADAAGNVYLAYCSSESYLRVMPAGSDSLGPAEAFSPANTDNPKLHVGADGSITALWIATGLGELWTSTREAGQTSWSTPTLLETVTNQAGMVQLVGNRAGRVTAAWVDSDYSSVGRVQTASRDPQTGTWSTPETFGTALTYVPGLAVDGNDATVLNYFTNDSGYQVYSRTLGAGDATFSSPFTMVPDGHQGGHLGFASRPDGSMYSLLMHGDMSGFAIGVRARGAKASAWDASVSDFSSPSPSVTDGGGLVADAAGNLVAAWELADGTPVVAVGDGAGPVLSNVSVPTSAEPGIELSFSATAEDVFSDEASVSFDFGDGTTKTGASVKHTYAAAGNYTVTVRSVDGNGFASTATRAVAVTAPSAPDTDDTPEQKPEPKKVLPPVTEALLAGKRVALSTKVNLKKGQRCAGNAVATTAFGTVTYRTTVKLQLIDGVCRAVGTVKLKKAPSLRTKLTVVISGKSVKTRKVTTRRS